MKNWKTYSQQESKEQFEEKLCKYVASVGKAYEDKVISKECLLEYFDEMSVNCPNECLNYLHNLMTECRKSNNILTLEEKLQECERRCKQYKILIGQDSELGLNCGKGI